MEVRLIRHFATEGNLGKTVYRVTDEEIKTECVPEYILEKRRKQTIREEKWTCEVGAGACDCQSAQEVQADGRDSFPGSGAGCL